MEITTALVVGANGYLGAHVVNRLLRNNLRVKACIRPGSLSEAKYLLALAENPEMLEIVEADIQIPESWSPIFSAGDAPSIVIHCGVPAFQNVIKADEAEAYVKASVDGVQTILDWCQNTPGVKRLVLASCISAICDEYVPDKTYNERDWNETSSLTRRIHAFARTQAEKCASEFVAKPDCSFEYVAILPGMLLGPHLKPGGTSHSFNLLLTFLEHKINGVPNLYTYITDVRDASNAISIAAENESGSISGRYLVVPEQPTSVREMLETITSNFDDIKVPSRKFADFLIRAAVSSPKNQEAEFLLHNVGRIPLIASDRAKEVGMAVRSPDHTVVDSVAYLKKIDAIHPKQGGGMCNIL